MTIPIGMDCREISKVWAMKLGVNYEEWWFKQDTRCDVL